MADKENKTAPEAENNMEKQEPEIKEEKTPEAEEKKKEKKPEKKSDKKNGKEAEQKNGQKPEPEQKPAQDTVAAESDRYLRLLAEFDNYRRRTQREKENIYTDAKSDAVTAFLPVYDNLERALAQPTEDETYRKGVEMTMNQLRSVFEKFGVSEIECIGKTFDPTCQNAVMHVEDDQKGENEVVEVFQKGFRLGDKIIRFAMVKVAN